MNSRIGSAVQRIFIDGMRMRKNPRILEASTTKPLYIASVDTTLDLSFGRYIRVKVRSNVARRVRRQTVREKCINLGVIPTITARLLIVIIHLLYLNSKVSKNCC